MLYPNQQQCFSSELSELNQSVPPAHGSPVELAPVRVEVSKRQLFADIRTNSRLHTCAKIFQRLSFLSENINLLGLKQ